MSVNIVNPSVSFHSLDSVDFTVVGGAVGWIDTDTSSVPTAPFGAVYVVQASVAGAQLTGVRATGETTVPLKTTATNTMWLSKMSNTRHLDLYRGAANAVYSVVGYLS